MKVKVIGAGLSSLRYNKVYLDKVYLDKLDVEEVLIWLNAGIDISVGG